MIDMEIINMISTVGFPIVAYLLMYIDLRRLIKENTIATQKMIEATDKMINQSYARTVVRRFK